MQNKAKNNKPTIKKEDFIEFLMSASPEDINKYIREKGKPAKLIEPIIFINDKH